MCFSTCADERSVVSLGSTQASEAFLTWGPSISFHKQLSCLWDGEWTLINSFFFSFGSLELVDKQTRWYVSPRRDKKGLWYFFLNWCWTKRICKAAYLKKKLGKRLERLFTDDTIQLAVCYAVIRACHWGRRHILEKNKTRQCFIMHQSPYLQTASGIILLQQLSNDDASGLFLIRCTCVWRTLNKIFKKKTHWITDALIITPLTGSWRRVWKDGALGDQFPKTWLNTRLFTPSNKILSRLYGYGNKGGHRCTFIKTISWLVFTPNHRSNLPKSGNTN